MKVTKFDAAFTQTLTGGLTTGSSSGGDLSGPMPAPTVVGIGGVPVDAPDGVATDYLNGAGHWTAPAGGTGLEVKEVDGSPDVTGVTQIIVSNGSLTDNTGGSVTIVTGGGGGGGSDVVNVASGAGSVTIPGLKGSADALPGSPSSYDQEFGAALSGWTALNSLDMSNANSDLASHYHIRKNTSGDFYSGIYRAAPSVPYTMTMKLTDYLHYQQYQGVGLMILDSTPTNLFAFGPIMNGLTYSADYIRMQGTVGGGRGTFADADGYPVVQYIRMIVTSGTNVTCQISREGHVWYTIHSGAASGLTPANFGIWTWAYNAVPAEGYIDWIRFT